MCVALHLPLLPLCVLTRALQFVEWNPQRFCLWPSMDGETLSAVAVRHLLSTNEQYPFLRVIGASPCPPCPLPL